MRINHQHINKVGRILVDSLLVMLLWTILALPASTFSLLKIVPQDQQDQSEVLSKEDVRPSPIINPQDKTKSFRGNVVPETTTSQSSPSQKP
jgi:Na+/H+-dicarboxylate symporter